MKPRQAKRALGGALGLLLLAFQYAPSAPAAAFEGGLDSRGWELVSPVAKNGGEVAPVGSGLLQAGAQGGAVAFASEASFGEAAGAAPVNQYLARRGEAGWGSANLTPALLAGTYQGDPYLLLSSDLSRAVVSGGWSCRGGGEECAAENPPLGAGGPPGYRNAYIHEGSSYLPLITVANFPALPAEAREFHLKVEGGSPDLHNVVFSSSSLLYEWNEGTIAAIGSAGATLAAPGNSRGAVSADGNRVYFTQAGSLELREGAVTKAVAPAAEFGAASPDGAVAFYLEADHVHRYDAVAEANQDLTPGGGATAILGASPDGAYLFYVAAGGIFRWHDGTATKVVADANLTRLPPTTGPAALAAGGSRLFFTAADSLLPSRDTNGQPDAYEWEAQGTGGCTAAPGCLGLLSSGRVGSATFATASASGEDAFFLTSVSLLPADPGAVDLYDARANGGFPEPPTFVECAGDDCQAPPFVPQDATPPTSSVSGPPNPSLKFAKAGCPKGKRPAAGKSRARCQKKKGQKKGPPHGSRKRHLRGAHK